jgi:hypothetical protein
MVFLCDYQGVVRRVQRREHDVAGLQQHRRGTAFLPTRVDEPDRPGTAARNFALTNEDRTTLLVSDVGWRRALEHFGDFRQLIS